MNKLKIQIILGSTRPNREGEKVAKWIYGLARQEAGFEAELLDLRDWPLPFYNEEASPAMLQGRYRGEAAQNWAKKVSEAEGYIIVTPEYNHGYSAVLKNALDYAYAPWNKKPVSFVSYSAGPIAGSRAVEQLREVAVELQMAPLRAAVHIPLVWQAFEEEGAVKDKDFEKKVKALFAELEWWGMTLKYGRNSL